MEEASVHLRSLLRISTLLQSTREMYASRGTRTSSVLQQHLLALIGDLVPYDEGSVFLYEHGKEIYPNLVAQALQSKAPVFETGELAVPLFLRDDIAGVIYLRRKGEFEETDFQLITAVSQLTSIAIENAFHLEWLQAEIGRLERDLEIEHDLLGDSVPMNELRGRIARVAPSEPAVLILGESGTVVSDGATRAM